MGKSRRRRRAQPGPRKVRKGSERVRGQKTQGPVAHAENWGFVPEARETDLVLSHERHPLAELRPHR